MDLVTHECPKCGLRVRGVAYRRHWQSCRDWEERFWRLVDFSGAAAGSSCWEWAGHKKTRGYGMFGCRGKPHSLAHRLAFELGHECRIPKGLFVCHRCDNPGCVRPEHLFLGTSQDNVSDMFAKGRGRKAQGEDAGRAKLTWRAVEYCRRVYAPRHPRFGASALARKFKVSTPAVAYAIRGQTWRMR